MIQTTPQAIGANVGALGSVGLATATWVVDLNAYLQLGATAVAFVAGCMAILWHVEKIRTARRERRDNKDMGQE